MQETYNLENIHQAPQAQARYAVIGMPVAQSLSPQMHHAGFSHYSLDANYIRFEVAPDDLAKAVAKLKELDFKGWNCTLPHKIKILDHVDEQDSSASLLQCANTIVNDQGRLIAFNTDGVGWVKAIREEFMVDVRDLRIMILGAGGGAGQALATQAAIEKCQRLVLVNRTHEKAQQLAQKLKSHFVSDQLLGAHERLLALPWKEELIAEQINHVDLIVNCTSIGWKPHEAPVLSPSLLQPHLFVYDTIYRNTRLLQSAKDMGARGANGLSMLLHQGALAFELWTGKTSPLDSMRKALQTAYH